MHKHKHNSKKPPPTRTAALAGIAAACILAFALVLAALLFAQQRESAALHTLPQPAAQGPNTQPAPAAATSAAAAAPNWPEGLDVQVTHTSYEMTGVLAPEEILPLAQEVGQRVFGQEFAGFVMLSCSEDETVYHRPIWRVYAYVGEEDALDISFDAKTGQNLSCVLEPNRWFTSEEVQRENERATGNWNTYTPLVPPEYRAELPVEPQFSASATAQANEEMAVFYENLHAETTAFIEANRSDPGIARARAFASESGILEGASIEDAWLLMREEGDSMYGYGLFSTYELRLSSGEWLVLGERDDTRFFSYSRPEHSQLELYELEIQRLRGEVA